MKTVRFFLGADLRAGHVGLKELARAEGVDLGALRRDEAVVFINRSKNKIKTYSYNKVVSYVRIDDPRRSIDFDALDEIPKSFRHDGTLDYTAALRRTLEAKLRLRKFEELEVV